MSHLNNSAPGREHIPVYPKGFMALRIVQLVFAIIVMGLAAYSASWLPTSGNIYIIVVALFTFVTSGYHLASNFKAPNLYNYWAVLGLDCFMVLMWLTSFALLATEARLLIAVTNYSYYTSADGYFYDDYYSGTASIAPGAACMGAAAGFGAFNFLFHIISLVIHSIRLHRHRTAGGQASAGASHGLPISHHPAAYPQPSQYFPPQQPQPQAAFPQSPFQNEMPNNQVYGKQG
ncbi:hypothetical protein B0H67DRAFT_561659 [Lasiosphaeris hirsuta]|uniref:MARVEL domain-containing protein n=1 Tax=Lasiosphaeris hirsuta TaxID=260670 RepID=A0AA40BA36_9PEZI|nr:hypothetical protein B0H67DRAFT_561659 [Lasiosphaeris hirsuta]